MTAPDPDLFWHTGGGLRAAGTVIDGRPLVVGQWDAKGLGYSPGFMRALAEAILAACDDADAKAVPNG